MYPIVMRIFTTMPYIELFVNKFLEEKLRFLQSKMYDFLAIDLLWEELLHEKHSLFANSIRIIIQIE
jgi:hypothetical protein